MPIPARALAKFKREQTGLFRGIAPAGWTAVHAHAAVQGHEDKTSQLEAQHALECDLSKGKPRYTGTILLLYNPITGSAVLDIHDHARFAAFLLAVTVNKPLTAPSNPLLDAQHGQIGPLLLIIVPRDVCCTLGLHLEPASPPTDCTKPAAIPEWSTNFTCQG